MDLHPFFHDELLKLIPSKYVICFDEAFNEISKKGQMDIVIRCWESSMDKVCSQYLSSPFMGHSTTEDIMNNILEASSEIKLCNLVQVSMDGPNVNWAFLEQLSSNLHDEYGTKMLFLGSCSLHVINGSLTIGHKATNWKVQVQLKSFFKHFKDSPARRADYIDFTGCNQFPKKFCSVRWVENVEVCERALEVFKHIKQYISKVKKLPNTFTVKTVREACADPLVEAKIAFFLFRSFWTRAIFAEISN